MCGRKSAIKWATLDKSKKTEEKRKILNKFDESELLVIVMSHVEGA